MLCANDHVAALLLRSLERAGVRVPDDMRMVGFDDVRFATLLSVPLTTMHQPCREIAQVALRAMLDRIDDPTIPPRGLALTPTPGRPRVVRRVRLTDQMTYLSGRRRSLPAPERPSRRPGEGHSREGVGESS